MRAGYRGGLAAWAGFTLPSALALVLFAYGAGALSGPAGVGLLHGLKLVAVAIVGHTLANRRVHIIGVCVEVFLPVGRSEFIDDRHLAINDRLYHWLRAISLRFRTSLFGGFGFTRANFFQRRIFLQLGCHHFLQLNS